MAIIKNPVTIVQSGGSEDIGYQPNTDMKWAKSVLENDVQEGFTYKVLQMISDGWVYSDLTVPIGGAVKTSDGAYYTDSGSVQHTWNDTNAKIPEYYQHMKLRWVITYYPQETASVKLLADVIYICFDSIKYTTSFSSIFMLEYFEHINGADYNSNSFFGMFKNCYSLKTIPQLDTSSGTNFQEMFSSCYSLETIPQLDTSSGTTFQSMFKNCYSLKTIPQLDTSKGTTFAQMFNSCYSLETIPQLDTSKGTTFALMFINCMSLKSIPLLNTSNAINFNNMFSYCCVLKALPQLDTSKGTNFYSTFYNCYSLQTIPELNLLSATDLTSIFSEARNLEFIKILNISKSLNLGVTTKLSRDTIVNNIIANLVDLTGQTSQTLTLGSTNLAKLSEEDKLLATSKNWVLA